MTRHSDPDRGATTAYRIVVEGRIGAHWGDWFGADVVIPGEETTELRIRVADEAELHGRLRRLRDLRVRLRSLVLLRPSDGRDASAPDPVTDHEAP